LLYTTDYFPTGIKTGNLKIQSLLWWSELLRWSEYLLLWWSVLLTCSDGRSKHSLLRTMFMLTRFDLRLMTLTRAVNPPYIDNSVASVNHTSDGPRRTLPRFA
jgi:hypothetical protein